MYWHSAAMVAFGLSEQVNQRAGDFVEIVRWYVGCHADRDASGAVK